VHSACTNSAAVLSGDGNSRRTISERSNKASVNKLMNDSIDDKINSRNAISSLSTFQVTRSRART
jgi:hypothetical protein